MLRGGDQDRRRFAELELRQAQYDASLAEYRHAACDPDNVSRYFKRKCRMNRSFLRAHRTLDDFSVELHAAIIERAGNWTKRKLPPIRPRNGSGGTQDAETRHCCMRRRAKRYMVRKIRRARKCGPKTIDPFRACARHRIRAFPS
jgi:hypothetical protein